MRKEDLVLAVLATTSDYFTPVQIQKFLFLLDKKIPQEIGGPHFNFIPYDYGPFDKQIYGILEKLENMEMISIQRHPYLKARIYCNTQKGQEQGDKILSNLNPNVIRYMNRLSEFIRNSSFAELVSSIYKEYPEMKKNSIFRD